MSIRATFIKKIIDHFQDKVKIKIILKKHTRGDTFKDAEEIVQKAVSGQKEQPQKQMQGHQWQHPRAKKRTYVESKNTTRQLIVSLIYTMYFVVDIGVVAVVWLETTTHSKFSLEILTLISK